MKVEAVELHHLSMRLQAPFETAFGVEHERQCVLIALRAEGLEGWGECVAGKFPGYSYETSQTAWSILSEFLIPALLEAEISVPQEVVATSAAVSGHPMAKAGLELAAWDLFGKLQNASLRELLGGQRSSVSVGVSIGIQPSQPQLLELIEGYLNQGYQRIKLKIKPGHDVALVAAVRQRYPDLALQVDANCSYRADRSGPLIELDQFSLLMIEQPYPREDLIGHIRLAEAVETPVCLDESVGSATEAAQALELGAGQIINIKPGRVGGLNEAVAIHDHCRTRNVPVWCGGMLETGIGRAANLALATLPGFTLPGDISASDRYYADDVAAPRFALNSDGTIDVPTGPGLGVEVDRKAVENFTLRQASFAD